MPFPSVEHQLKNGNPGGPGRPRKHPRRTRGMPRLDVRLPGADVEDLASQWPAMVREGPFTALRRLIDLVERPRDDLDARAIALIAGRLGEDPWPDVAPWPDVVTGLLDRVPTRPPSRASDPTPPAATIDPPVIPARTWQIEQSWIQPVRMLNTSDKLEAQGLRGGSAVVEAEERLAITQARKAAAADDRLRHQRPDITASQPSRFRPSPGPSTADGIAPPVSIPAPGPEHPPHQHLE